MKFGIVLTTAALCVAGAGSPAAGQSAGGSANTEGSAAAPASVPSGTYLSRVLARLRAGEPVRVDVPVEVRLPESRSAAEYAARYRISPQLAQDIIDIALEEGIDPELGFRLIRVESVFRTRARGPSGSLGLTQLMPATARSIDRSVRTEAEILEPSTNLRLGFRYLRRMIERYDGDVRLGLLAYNRGQTAVNRALRAGRDPENGYSHKVLGTRGQDPYRGLGLLARAN